MKILITQYEMMDLGGIVNDLEALVSGLRDLGHEVSVRQLVWKDSVKDQRTSKTDLIVGSLGIPYDQTGWIWPASMRMPYKGRENIQRFREYASGFDLVVWHMPVPSKNAQNRGNSDWLWLYDIDVDQVAYCHDGNFPTSYPWLLHIAHKLIGVVATQGAAAGSLRRYYAGRSALILSGQQDMARRIALRQPWGHRLPGVYSNFTAKGWKRLEDYIRAVPHMNSYPLTYAGNGIALRYMRSKDKCKPEFFVQKKFDPDIGEEHYGKRIWDLALENDLKYRDYVHPEERDNSMARYRLHLDPSWSKKYSQLGSHFNRTTVEAMIVGTIPVARNLGIGTDESGDTDIFYAGKNYVMIPWNATPKEFAEIIDHAANFSEDEYQTMLDSWDSFLGVWDNRAVAQRLLQFATEDSPSDGVFAHHIGPGDDEVRIKGLEYLHNHFGV